MRVVSWRRVGGWKASKSRIHLVRCFNKSLPPSARRLSISNFDVRAAVWMEKVTSSLAIQEVELVKLQREVDELLAGNTEHLTLDPPEELVKARVENEKLKYGFPQNLFCTASFFILINFSISFQKVPTKHLEKGRGEGVG